MIILIGYLKRLNNMRDLCTDCPFRQERIEFHCPEEEGYLCPHLAMKNGYNPAKLGGG